MWIFPKLKVGYNSSCESSVGRFCLQWNGLTLSAALGSQISVWNYTNKQEEHNHLINLLTIFISPLSTVVLKDKKTNQTRIKCGSPMIVLSAIFSGDVIDCVSFWRMSQFSDLGIVGTSLADLRFF